MQGVVRRNWGQQVFEQRREYKLYGSLTTTGTNNYLGVELPTKTGSNNYFGAEFQEGVIIWHIATDVFIAKSRGDDAGHETQT
jgi:hypothetical protein